jgi:hypothetical protein
VTRGEVERLTALETKMEAVEKKLDRVADGQTELLQALARYKGAMGMLAVLGSCLTAAIGLILAWLRSR